MLLLYHFSMSVTAQIYTVNRKNTSPCFSTFLNAPVSPESLELQKNLFTSFISFSKELFQLEQYFFKFVDKIS